MGQGFSASNLLLRLQARSPLSPSESCVDSTVIERSCAGRSGRHLAFPVQVGAEKALPSRDPCGGTGRALVQSCPAEPPVVPAKLRGCAVQNGSHSPQVAVEQLKSG